LRKQEISGPGPVFFYAQKKSFHVYECIYVIGLDHVPFLHTKSKRLLQPHGYLSGCCFFPILSELNFKQEGHRLEVEETPEEGIKLVYKGVVYNEMKGAMSSADQVMGRSLLNALYPDTTYQFNSGGDPSEIPNLPIPISKNFTGGTIIRATPFFILMAILP
jgi:hypothetical protein